MTTCIECGKQIKSIKEEIGIRERNQTYHVSCAPDGLLDDAIEEWEAILTRGVRYFVNKYIPSATKRSFLARRVGEEPRERELLAYSELFERMGNTLRSEIGARRGK